MRIASTAFRATRPSVRLVVLALLLQGVPTAARAEAPAVPVATPAAAAALSPATLAALARLDDPDPRARILAARTLAGDAAALDPLAARLAKESDPALRRALMDALGRLPLSEAALIRAVEESPEPAARAFAAHTLGRAGTDAAVGALLAATADADTLVRKEAYDALGRAGDRVALDTLKRAAVRDPAAGCREAAVAAAELLASAPTVPPDVTIDLARLRGGTADERAAAARSLGESGDRRALEPLLEAARATEPPLAQAAIGALGRLGDARAVPPLLALLGTTAGRTRYVVLGALAALRDESSVDPLVVLLADPDPSARKLAVRALGWIAPDDLFTRLAPAQLDPLEDVRAEVLAVASQSHAPTRVAALLKALDDPSPFLRAEAVRLCAEAGITGRIPSLLSDPDALVRLAAADALDLLRPPGAAAAVRGAATRARDPEERAHLDTIAARLESTGLPMEAGDR
ncbi:MAG: HEAT repeat domain-containing protein [Pseudomonadota bacterium]|nr:HEAT repeat domain-containing protein [Pseudomonadota bacterium]